MPLTASVTVFSAAIAVPAADSAIAIARAERIRFIATSSNCRFSSRPEQHRGQVVERDGRQYQRGRRPEYGLDTPPRQRPRAGTVGAGDLRLAVDEPVADAEEPGGRGEEERLGGRPRPQRAHPRAPYGCCGRDRRA